ncbi:MULTISPECIES: hypothetical protein [Streptomyces]|uniref:Uncharacterized protein n=1 Tax=Streptomyces flavovirens TaxID=52258 RepID=A0ABV8NCA4_9ACTN|nr:hypothetical protein [Streptomyces sp. MBT51]MBK3596265.1 hypothetical protein [Streptomyces sp. MBT51]
MAEMTEARRAEIQAMTFTTGVNAAHGVFATDTERDLYRLAARCWNAMQELLRDNEQLRQAHAQTAEELATWTGAVNP